MKTCNFNPTYRKVVYNPWFKTWTLPTSPVFKNINFKGVCEKKKITAKITISSALKIDLYYITCMKIKRSKLIHFKPETGSPWFELLKGLLNIKRANFLNFTLKAIDWETTLGSEVKWRVGGRGCKVRPPNVLLFYHRKQL